MLSNFNSWVSFCFRVTDLPISNNDCPKATTYSVLGDVPKIESLQAQNEPLGFPFALPITQSFAVAGFS